MFSEERVTRADLDRFCGLPICSNIAAFAVLAEPQHQEVLRNAIETTGSEQCIHRYNRQKRFLVIQGSRSSFSNQIAAKGQCTTTTHINNLVLR
jgi:hypothetical protein